MNIMIRVLINLNSQGVNPEKQGGCFLRHTKGLVEDGPKCSSRTKVNGIKPANVTNSFNIDCKFSNELQNVIHPLQQRHPMRIISESVAVAKK